MKPLSPHDPLDDLIAAALHGELTPEERAQFDSRLSNDPAAQAAYQEAQAMHELLEKTHQSAQPDSAFEQRMVSGVRRKLETEQHRETALESFIVLWTFLKSIFGGRSLWTYGGVCSVVLVLFLMFAVYSGNQVKSVFTTITSQLALASSDEETAMSRDKASLGLRASVANRKTKAAAAPQLAFNNSYQKKEQQFGGKNQALANAENLNKGMVFNGGTTVTAGETSISDNGTPVPPAMTAAVAPAGRPTVTKSPPMTPFASGSFVLNDQQTTESEKKFAEQTTRAKATGVDKPSDPSMAQIPATNSVASVTEPAPADNRKLIRNAQLDLEVKSYQDTIDKITPMTKSAGGYVDTSHSEKGGNGKLHGTVVVKVLPQNLDAFLLKLRDLGQVNNQSVSTDDVTKDYYDTQARLENSRRMEIQLQELLKHENGKVSDLLAVERELGRVRGEIEQMQGQLKLYDFQVQYATVTMEIAEKDLNQAAAYLLKERDNFSLFATDVEGTFQKARQSADSFKAQILTANLNHNSGSDVSAELVVMVAPDQIEAFLGDVRSLGRVANFTRQTQRIAKDGGDSDQPADQTLTEKDKVQVHLAIRSDDESRKRVALTVVAKAVDSALEQAKTAALANAGVEILGFSLNKTPQGESTAQLTVRVPGKDYAALIESFNALGRTASLSIQRNDNSGPGATGDDAPVIVSLSLTDNDTPLQETQLSVLASDVDVQAQQIKKDAATAGVEVKASSFERQPDGTELAQMVFRLPMAKNASFMATLQKLGKVESLTVRRDDRPDQTRTDDTAPVEISLQLHNQRGIVADNDGLWATLRKTFGDGAGALFASIRVIGVCIAFLAPWVFTIILVAWIGRRIYVWRKR